MALLHRPRSGPVPFQCGRNFVPVTPVEPYNGNTLRRHGSAGGPAAGGGGDRLGPEAGQTPGRCGGGERPQSQGIPHRAQHVQAGGGLHRMPQAGEPRHLHRLVHEPPRGGQHHLPGLPPGPGLRPGCEPGAGARRRPRWTRCASWFSPAGGSPTSSWS